MYLEKVLERDPKNKDAQNDVSQIFNKLLLLVFCLFGFHFNSRCVVNNS